MNLLKRSLVSVTRNKGKNLLLMLLIAGFGTLMSGTIILSQSINQNRDNLWRQLPPAVVIDVDHDIINEIMSELSRDERMEWDGLQLLTPQILQPILDLSYVRTFDIFNGTTIFTRDLNRVLLDFPMDWDHQSLIGYDIVEIELFGVTNPEVLNIQNGFLRLISGRTFAENEMNPINPHKSVVMIPTQLAELNGLEVGDMITFENNFYRHQLWAYMNYGQDFSDEHIMEYELYELEIIGLFEPVVIPDFGNPMQELFANNNIIVPLPVVNAINDFMFERWHEDDLANGMYYELILSSESSQRNIILLSDAADLPSFIDAATELLPSFYHVGTFSNSVLAVERFNHSMDFFQGLSVQTFWFVLAVAIVSISLVVLLFLRDRKHELGIYLALGEDKLNIIKQIIYEILLPSIFGITISLFLGGLLADVIGREMLINNVIAGQDFNLDDYGWSDAGAQLQWFMDDQIDTVIENYDVGMNMVTTVLFYIVGVATVTVSTFGALVYIMKLEPKDILLVE